MPSTPRENKRSEQQTQSPPLETVDHRSGKRGIEIRRNAGHACEDPQTALRPTTVRRQRHQLGDGLARLRNDDLLAGRGLVHKPRKMRLGGTDVDDLHGRSLMTTT